jgi:predicted DsbA family dithiol-disulfide isomerase
MKIELWSDFACPFCFIGKTQFDQALNDFEHKDAVEVVYKAYQLNPNAPKEMTTDAATAFAKGHGMSPEQAKERFNMFVSSAQKVGLNYNYDIIQMTNSYDAHVLAKWARKFGKEPALTNLLMSAYFEQGKNIASKEDLLEIVKECGLPVEEASEILNNPDEFKAVVDFELKEAREVGVRGVPFFVINRKYGVSGAQGYDNFLNALKQIYEEEQQEPLKTFDIGGDGAACDDEGCE